MRTPKPRFPRCVGQWREDAERRSTNGRRLWRCWQCDSLSPWSDGHGCYCSYQEIEDGHPFPVW